MLTTLYGAITGTGGVGMVTEYNKRERLSLPNIFGLNDTKTPRPGQRAGRAPRNQYNSKLDRETHEQVGKPLLLLQLAPPPCARKHQEYDFSQAQTMRKDLLSPPPTGPPVHQRPTFDGLVWKPLVQFVRSCMSRSHAGGADARTSGG